MIMAFVKKRHLMWIITLYVNENISHVIFGKDDNRNFNMKNKLNDTY